MVAVIEAASAAPIDLDGLFAAVSAIAAPQMSPAFIEQAAHYLQRFNANRHLIRSLIDQRGGLHAARSAFVPPQTFVFGMRGDLGVRANVWPRIRQATHFEAQERLLYAYELPHNHDFSFLTVGHFGEGYATDLYEVDPDSVTGQHGQQVTLFNHRRETLSEGRVLAFSAYSDLHTQYPPEDGLAISINLILLEKRAEREQVFFDLENSRVISHANEGTVGRMVLSLDMAAAFATGDTAGLMDRIAIEGRYPRLRDVAAAHADRLRRHVDAV